MLRLLLDYLYLLAMLLQEAGKVESKVKIACKGKEVEVSKLFAIMTLEVKCGDTVTITVEGPDEEAASQTIKKFFEERL